MVTSDSLPQVDFLGLENFIVDAGSQGSDVVTFKTWFLQGALPGNYQADQVHVPFILERLGQ